MLVLPAVLLPLSLPLRYPPPLLPPLPPPSPPLLPPHPPPPLLPSPIQQSFCITDSAIPTSPLFAPLSPLASFIASLPHYLPSPPLLLPHTHRAFMASSRNPPITAIPPLLPPPLTLSTWISGVPIPSDPVPTVVINWAEQCRNHIKCPIGRLHSDCGGEFINNTLATFCTTHGIQQTSTLPHSPQQNGIAESRIREITKIARCLIAHASTPPSPWSYALLHAALLLNLRSHPQHPSSSPTELWSKAKPDAAGLRFWGCKSFVLIPPADRSRAAGKLAPRAMECAYLGHNRDSPSYLFLHPPTNHLIRSTDVVFDESIPYYSTPPPDPLPPPSRPLA
ncbi:unnamed protein product [Closterium sp. NIES-54]